MFQRVVFPLLGFLVCLGCDDSITNNSSTSSSSSSSSSGDIPLPPPVKAVWTPTSTTGAPAGRYAHTAVWAGSQMIVWGGEIDGVVTNTGGLYDPTTDTWKPMSTTGAPAARFGHVAVWTGSKMLVWGGFGAAMMEPAGGVYDPATDKWTPMSTNMQPQLRLTTTAIWTGSKMVIWGGRVDAKAVGSGGMYDPATDTWSTLNTAGAPSARYFHRGGWSGSSMLVWGGSNSADWMATGAFFDPTGGPTGVWTSFSTSKGVPEARDRHTLSFAHKWFIVWGGWNGGAVLNSGGLLHPETNTWITTNPTNAPTARMEQTSVWAGTHEFVWGGCGETQCLPQGLLADGGQFTPDSKGGTWYPIEKQDALAARYSHTLVYTGNGVIVWGGRFDTQTATNTGAFAPL